MLICKYCRIMPPFPIFVAVMASKGHNNITVLLNSQKKIPPGMLLGQIQNEIKSQAEFFLSIFVWADDWRLSGGTVPRCKALSMMGLLLASSPLLLIFSLFAFSTSLRSEKEQPFPLCTIQGPAKNNRSQEMS